MNSNSYWTHIQLFCTGDAFFNGLISAIDRAESSLLIEFYIFQTDEIGKKVLHHLAEARKRGVDIQLLVDGIGSLDCLTSLQEVCVNHKIHFRVYHPVSFLSRYYERGLPYLERLIRILNSFNTRNHRKLVVVDGKRAFVGSMNIWDVHSYSVKGDLAWKDHSVLVEGPPVSILTEAFENAWQHASISKAKSRIINRLQAARRKETEKHSPYVLLNDSWKRRKTFRKKLYRSLLNAQQRLHLSTPYFNPNRQLLSSLISTARRGVEVCLLLPSKTDVEIAGINNRNFYPPLLKAGVRIFEYQKSILHSKLQIIDNKAYIGSPNLNLRSLIHDLEVQVVLDDPKSLQIIEQEWISELKESQEFSWSHWKSISIWHRIFIRFSLIFRYLM